ncbi:hypothetical protein [Winogradskyella aquimaris]|uniref:Anti-sigma factor n=1 Tax=Winogradskyella aquimaris TaxID=864074 RepID=A0ABU5ELD7_9FLAO|nr:hypothetical protein [Winogradskyella aquimaris]MDY2587245.1 hypothetical protein [Winogradskyella aquimaris]
MKQDIREFFKDQEDLKTPPANHRKEFLDKLKAQNQSKKVGQKWLNVVAVVIVALTLGFTVLYKKPTEEVSPIIAQVEALEADYLKEINTEWDNFIAIADDEVLVVRFRKRLDDLDKDYQLIAEQFKGDVNNIQVVEALVENLQTRLQILKDIQEHIKILNQKNEQHEKSI